jgi:hypothetical protein
MGSGPATNPKKDSRSAGAGRHDGDAARALAEAGYFLSS